MRDSGNNYTKELRLYRAEIEASKKGDDDGQDAGSAVSHGAGR